MTVARRPIYYDMDGQPISMIDMAALYEGDQDARRVAADEIGDARVSTVLLGIDHNFGGGPPLIFETMIFGDDHDQFQWRYSTREAAEAGHRQIIEALQRGEPPPDDLPI